MRVNRRFVPQPLIAMRNAVYALFFLVFISCIVENGVAQEPDVHFIDADGKTIAEVPAQLKDETVYLSVDAVKQIFDPAMTHQYNHPRKRLTLRMKGKRIRLQMDKPTINIDPGGEIVRSRHHR